MNAEDALTESLRYSKGEIDVSQCEVSFLYWHLSSTDPTPPSKAGQIDASTCGWQITIKVTEHLITMLLEPETVVPKLHSWLWTALSDNSMGGML